MKQTKQTLDRLFKRGKYNFSLSNFHETEAYLEDVIRDINSLNLSVNIQIRDRQTAFRWKSKHRFRDDNNEIYPNIKIRNKEEIINLEAIEAQTFIEAKYSPEFCANLICENKSYEINITCNLQEEIFQLAYFFEEHSLIGNLNAWRDAYETPAIIIEGQELKIEGFEEIFLFRKRTSSFEASFLMPTNRLFILPYFEKQMVYANQELIDYIYDEFNK